MKMPIVKLNETRVRRQYSGGAGIEKMHGRPGVDGYLPEEWIASITPANNSEMEPLVNEGLCMTAGEQSLLLKEIIESDPEFYLGKAQTEKIGAQIGVLVKFLDSSIRLPIQAHPTREYAKKNLNSMWGKSEAYYFLSVREDVNPYFLLGFNREITRDEWKDLIEKQDIEGIVDCLNKIPVHEGEVWYIPAGIVHAIGEGITMVEIMEPSDLVVRCEFERIKGKRFPYSARFMGKSLDEVLDIFDYTPYTPSQISDKSKIIPLVEHEDSAYTKKLMIPKEKTGCFSMEMLEIHCEMNYQKRGTVAIMVVTKGTGTVSCNGLNLNFQKGDSFLIPASSTSLDFSVFEESSICLVFPEID